MLVEMKKRGESLQKHYRQAFDYGFTAKKDLLAQLLALNLDVAAKIEKGESVTAPGMPKNYPDPEKLVTEDCIKPVSFE